MLNSFQIARVYTKNCLNFSFNDDQHHISFRFRFLKHAQFVLFTKKISSY